MKFYRLDKRHEAGTSVGFEYFTNRRDAEKAFRDWLGDEEETVCDREGSEITVIHIKPTKAGILHALNNWANHPDNG